jgi:hypothetical protein
MPVRLTLEISRADPLSGRLRRDDGEWQEFIGWTAFSLLLGAAVDEVPASAPGPAAST